MLWAQLEAAALKLEAVRCSIIALGGCIDIHWLTGHVDKMENGHKACADTCRPDGQAETSQANGCGQGCNGGPCQDRKTPSAPAPKETDCSSIYCDPVTAAGRPLSALDRRMCFKCKTSKAEVGCCVDRCKSEVLLCRSIGSNSDYLTTAGLSKAARAFVLGLFPIQLRKDCEAYHTHQVPD